jgi:Domain of unknown function (DUF4440)
MEVAMKGYVCLFLLWFATPLFAQSNTNLDETAVLAVQRQWFAASQKGDGQVLHQIIDDRFVGSTPDNHIINKQSLFPPTGSEPMFTGSRFVDPDAKVIGDTAIVFGRMITPGEPGVRCAMIYRKQAGTWKMIAAHMVPVSDTKDADAR